MAAGLTGGDFEMLRAPLSNASRESVWLLFTLATKAAARLGLGLDGSAAGQSAAASASAETAATGALCWRDVLLRALLLIVPHLNAFVPDADAALLACLLRVLRAQLHRLCQSGVDPHILGFEVTKPNALLPTALTQRACLRRSSSSLLRPRLTRKGTPSQVAAAVMWHRCR